MSKVKTVDVVELENANAGDQKIIAEIKAYLIGIEVLEPNGCRKGHKTPNGPIIFSIMVAPPPG